MQLAQQAQVLQAPLVAADQARSLVHRLAERPIWPMLTALLLIAWRPVRTVRWAARLWWTWRGYQKLRFWLTRQC